MIETKKVRLKISQGILLKYYRELGYDCSIGDNIIVDIKDLQRGSNIEIVAKCDYCNKSRNIPYKVYNLRTSGVNRNFSCSSECGKIKKEETNILKYGAKNPFESNEVKDKIKETLLRKYGVDNFRKSDEYKVRYTKTIMEKYGVDHYSKTDKFKKIFNDYDYVDISTKMRKTSLLKYGTEYYSRTDAFRQSHKKISFSRYSQRVSDIGELISIENGLNIKCHSCNNIYNILPHLYYVRSRNKEIICVNCNPKRQPIIQNNISEYLSEYIELESNNRKILDGKEIDIYVASKKLAIEFNGLYWHSELYLSKNYHLDKTNSCNELNIDLFHIWEDDWNYKQDIIKSMLLNKIGKTPNKIYGRKTIIKEIQDTKLVSKFLDDNHLQGKVGSKIKIGLFYNNELVSLMTFGGLRKNLGQKSKEGNYEMVRFCNKKYTNVIGGASKLFKYFVEKYKPRKVISYASRDYSNGNLYKQLGFELESVTEQGYKYTDTKLRYGRFNFRKDKLIQEGYDPSLTEHEIMLDRGYYRIYDTGNFKYSFS